MIVVNIKGGLGNQLFRYATGRSLSLKNNEKLKLDVRKSQQTHADPRSDYDLHFFNIKEEFATVKECRRYKNKGIRSFLEKLLPYYRRSFVRQQGRGFDQKVMQHARNSYIDGHWQHEEYFKNFASIIRTDITLKPKYERELNKEKDLVKKIKESNSVAVHVRRNDYVKNPEIAKKHGALSDDYYLKAIKYVDDQLIDPHYFIFSDDLDWCRENLQFKGQPVTFVEHNIKQDYMDLMLMRMCKHAIIANSSFSWWGAWLSDHPDKVVVAPTPWLVNDPTDKINIVPNRWYKISR